MTSSPSKEDIKLVTLGCRLNIFESEVMKNHAKANGLKNTVIINTCAVTNEAERQSRQAIRKEKRINKDAKIIVTGCSAQINPESYNNMPEVDLVLGNYEKMQKESFNFQSEAKVQVNNIMEIQETASHLISGFDGKSRAFIEIQNGCDHRCTFCTIPYGRGNNRSVPMPSIIKQTQILVDKGYKEIILTGVDITDYGKNLPNNPSLGNLCKRLLKNVPNLPRLRLSSIDPVEIDNDIFDLVKYEPRLMPHFHVSLQAGDNLILKRMKRRHLREDVIAFCKKLKNLRSDIVFGADIIAGFPTETEKMFENTLQVVKECNLTYLHVFPYSARKDTPAARMPQILKSIRKERASKLRELGNLQKRSFFNSMIGKTVNVLIEKDNFGYCEHYAPVNIEIKRKLLPNSIFRIRSVPPFDL